MTKIPAFLSIFTLSFSFLACTQKTESKTDNVTIAKVTNPTQTQQKTIAYVEIDSLMTQYQYCIDKKAKLESKAKQYEQQVKTKMQQAQNAILDFQQKVQTGAFKSQAEGEAAQTKVKHLQEQAVKLEQELTQKIAKEQTTFNKVLRDSVQSYLKIYNKEAKYDIILSKQGDNVLYANRECDITQQIIDGLNKRYKK